MPPEKEIRTVSNQIYCLQPLGNESLLDSGNSDKQYKIW